MTEQETTSNDELTPQTTLRRSEQIMFSDIDQDKVMIDIERSAYFGLNAVASEIWDMLETPQTPEQIIARLLEVYEVDEATCRTETMAALDRMFKLKLVERAA